MSDQITRRRFLRRLTVFGGTAMLLPSLAHAQAEPTWVPLGPTGNFPVDATTHVVLPDAYHGEELYVTLTGPGEYRVLSARCSHKGCIVKWNEKRKQFDCPCHGGVFDDTGSNIGGPPPSALTSLPVRIDDQGHLCVQIMQS